MVHDLSCAFIELWMHLGTWKNTWEASESLDPEGRGGGLVGGGGYSLYSDDRDDRRNF